MEQIEKNRFFTMAETYDKLVQLLLPEYNYLQNSIFNIIDFNKNDKINIIDLGAGSGILLEKILKRFPNAACSWIDYSDSFLNIAKKRLSKYKKNINFIISPIEDNWEEKVKDKPDLILSMSAVHHLTTDEKKSLYKKAYNILNRNGWFINIDEMKTLEKDSYLNSLNHWVKHVESYENKIDKSLIKYYHRWKNHFDNWKIRNVDNINIPKKKGDDLHDSFLDQLYWLKEIGYANIDLFVKNHLWCVIGGKKNIG